MSNTHYETKVSNLLRRVFSCDLSNQVGFGVGKDQVRLACDWIRCATDSEAQLVERFIQLLNEVGKVLRFVFDCFRARSAGTGRRVTKLAADL